jgi:hypothetical protein
MVLTTGNHLMVAHHEGRRSWPEGLKPHPEEPAVAGVSKDGAHPALNLLAPYIIYSIRIRDNSARQASGCPTGRKVSRLSSPLRKNIPVHF